MISLRRVAASREPVRWAFLSALGAQLVVRAIGQLLLLTFAPTLIRPFDLFGSPARALTPDATTVLTFVASVVGAAVAVRVGGIRALALLAAFDLLADLVAVFSFQPLCDVASQTIFFGRCLFVVQLIALWPQWAGVALGGIAHRLVPIGDGAGNHALRAAGVVTFVPAVINIATGLLFLAAGSATLAAAAALAPAQIAVSQFASTILAGIAMARARAAAAVLVTILMVVPQILTLIASTSDLRQGAFAYGVLVAVALATAGAIVLASRAVARWRLGLPVAS